MVACGSDTPSGGVDETNDDKYNHVDSDSELESQPNNDLTEEDATTNALINSGTGDELIIVEQPCDGPTILYIKDNQERELLQVSGYRSDRTRTNIFVDVTDEPYEGITLDVSGSTVYLDIKTMGSWAIEIRPLSVARVIQAPGAIKGNGDEVLLVKGSPKQAAIKGNHDEKYLIITSYSPGKNPVGLVFTADLYEDTVPIADDTHVLGIKTFGEWEISLE